jgi:hypothetical protein
MGEFKKYNSFFTGWLLVFGLLFAVSFIISIEAVLGLTPTLQAIIMSIIYNGYYFLAPNHFP